MPGEEVKNQLAPQLGVLQSQAGGLLAWTLIAQQFLHSRWHQRYVRPQLPQLVWMAQKREQMLSLHWSLYSFLCLVT